MKLLTTKPECYNSLLKESLLYLIAEKKRNALLGYLKNEFRYAFTSRPLVTSFRKRFWVKLSHCLPRSIFTDWEIYIQSNNKFLHFLDETEIDSYFYHDIKISLTFLVLITGLFESVKVLLKVNFLSKYSGIVIWTISNNIFSWKKSPNLEPKFPSYWTGGVIFRKPTSKPAYPHRCLCPNQKREMVPVIEKLHFCGLL